MDRARIGLLAEACAAHRKQLLQKTCDAVQLYLISDNSNMAESAMREGLAGVERYRELETELQKRIGFNEWT